MQVTFDYHRIRRYNRDAFAGLCVLMQSCGMWIPQSAYIYIMVESCKYTLKYLYRTYIGISQIYSCANCYKAHSQGRIYKECKSRKWVKAVLYAQLFFQSDSILAHRTMQLQKFIAF